MKKITLLLAFLISSIGFSQTYDLLTNGDFSDASGSPWTGNNFSVVSGEGYISATSAGGNPWDSQLVHGSLAFENTTEYTLTFWARAAAARTITVAIQNVGAWSDQFRQENIALTTTMTEYTYTFNATADNNSVQIGFLMGGSGSTDAIYYDDISLVTAGSAPETCSDGIQNQDETNIDCGGVCGPCAITPPTAPTNDAADVISLYTDIAAYDASDIEESWHPGWGQTTVYSSEQYASTTDNYVKLENFGYEGMTIAATDISAMETLHLDVYSVDETSIKIFAIVAGEPQVTKTLTPGQWNSIDIQLSEYTGAVFTSFTGLKLESGTYTWPNGASTIYVDNIFLYKAPTVSGSDATLSDLALDGTTIDSFSNNTTSYTYATNSIPTVTATTTDANATAVITQATTIPGDATVVVTAQDGTTTKTYTVSFVDPPITTLNIDFSGSSGFNVGEDAVFSEAGGIGTVSNINAQDYSHIYLDIPEGIDLSSSDRGFSLKVKGDKAIPIKLKLEGGTGNEEKDANYTTPNSWETITFDFSTATTTGQTKIVIFFDITGEPTGGKGVAGKTAAVDAFDIDDLVFKAFAALSLEDLKQFNFSIYPNPANNFVQLKAAKAIDFVEVYDVMGRSVLKNMPNAKEKTLNVSSLSKGMYIVKIGIDGAVGTSKLLKQ